MFASLADQAAMQGQDFPADLALVFAVQEAELAFVGQLLRAVGFNRVQKAATLAEFLDFVHRHPPDLVALACDQDQSAQAALRQLRASAVEAVRRLPVLALCAPLSLSEVHAARDAGVNILLSKPVSLRVLRERLAWQHRAGRPFIVTPSYVGPDRRHGAFPLPPGVFCRRKPVAERDGLPASATLSQETIDSAFFSEI